MDYEISQSLQLFYRSVIAIIPAVIMIICIVIFLMITHKIVAIFAIRKYTEEHVDAEAKAVIREQDAEITFLKKEVKRITERNQIMKASSQIAVKALGA